MRPYEPLLVVIAIGKIGKSGSWIIGKVLLSTRTTVPVQPVPIQQVTMVILSYIAMVRKHASCALFGGSTDGA